MIKLLVAAAFLSANFYVYHWMARDAVTPPRETFESFPLTLGDWSCETPEVIDDETLANLGATDYLICSFQNPNAPAPVTLYIGYHSTQVREEGGGASANSIHPPAHCLPGSGWDIVHSESLAPDLPGFPTESPRIKRLIVAKGEHRQLVYYWYHSRGRVLAEDWQKILYVGWDRATRSRTDGALVRFTVPVIRNDVEQAEAGFDQLASLVVPELSRFAPN
jgi:EpsI family protein